MNIDIDFQKLLRFGLTKEKLSGLDIVILPENIEVAEKPEELFDGSSALQFTKELKSHDVKCASSFDLGIDQGYMERRGGDIWLGTILIINDLAIPFMVSILANMVTSKTDKNEKEGSEPKVYVKLRMNKKGKINSLDYKGDGPTLLEMLKKLK